MMSQRFSALCAEWLCSSNTSIVSIWRNLCRSLNVVPQVALQKIVLEVRQQKDGLQRCVADRKQVLLEFTSLLTCCKAK
jgi:hypothetical protein